VTPIGGCLPQTAAAVRAGLGKIGPSGLNDRFGNPLRMALVDLEQLPVLVEHFEDYPLNSTRHDRLVSLGGAALREALPPDAAKAPVVVYLGVAEPRTEAQHAVGAELLEFCGIQAGVAIHPLSRTFPLGRASGLVALREALKLLAGGEVSQVIVGAVDSYWDLPLLEALEADGRLNAGEISDGFIPGEAAAFVTLARGRAGDAGPAVRVIATAQGEEAGHLYSPEPYRGDGLSATLQALFAEPGAETLQQRVGCVYAGLNGESFWAKEWGVSQLRNAERFTDSLRIHHPADCMGDPGAALGLVMLGLAAFRLKAGLELAPTLIWAGSDRETRAAVLLAASG